MKRKGEVVNLDKGDSGVYYGVTIIYYLSKCMPLPRGARHWIESSARQRA